MPSLILLLAPSAFAGEFMDIWLTTAIEDTNVRTGPEYFSPQPNFVARGNRTFFEDYESRFSDDISRGTLVLYRQDPGFHENWSTEAALVLLFTPWLNPDATRPGVDLRDDGSYVRVVRKLPGEKHNLSLTGYAVDAGRFRLGYSWDLSYGGREIITPSVGAMPGARLQYQRPSGYLFVGAKTAVNQRTEAEWEGNRNATYYGLLAGGGFNVGEHFKLEAGTGSFQQGQILNVADSSSPLYGEMITAVGVSGQVSYRTRAEINFIETSELKLYRNSPDFVRDTYIVHQQLDGFGMLVQAEANHLVHNLLDADNEGATVLEHANAADLQTMFIYNSTEVWLDFVYKDLSYIVFNVPGLTSGTSLPSSMTVTPQLYMRVRAAHYFPKQRLTPSLGMGLMQPATYTTSDGHTFVQYTARDKEAVPDGGGAYQILGAIGGVQYDISKSTVAVGELLYTLDNNQSRAVVTEDGDIIREAEPKEVRSAIGFNVMIRARF